MARNDVKSIDKFIEKFPASGTATIRFDAAPENGEPYIQVQAKQADERILTYTHEMKEASHEVVKRQASELVKKLDAAEIKHDPITDDTPKT